MTKNKAKKRVYTQEFKEQAVKLSYELGVEKAAEKLDVPYGNINRWRHCSKTGITQKSKDHLALQKEIKDLKLKLAKEKEIVEMLKKSTAFFSNHENESKKN